MSQYKKPVNYLNNKDLLKEIHQSKNSYSTFLAKGDDRYDLIIDRPDLSLSDTLVLLREDQTIEMAKTIRATRLSAETGTEITAKDISTNDVIFRVMTWDHIPLSPKAPKKINKKKTAKEILDFDEETSDLFEELEEDFIEEIDDMVHTRVNFPPFQHWKINDDELLLVGKSHWRGDLGTGEFCKDHGQITDKLARMYLMICEKYAMKYNWRGYSYLDEMVASAVLQLTYVGLRFNESKSSNPFAYFTQTITNSFCRVLNSEKKNQSIRDDILELNNLAPSYSRANQQVIAEN